MLRVFVDGHPVDVPAGATALDAARALDPRLATDVDAGTRVITDSRGLAVPSETAAVRGSIFRIIAQRRAPTVGPASGDDDHD